jgi:hypothetical protein
LASGFFLLPAVFDGEDFGQEAIVFSGVFLCSAWDRSFVPACTNLMPPRAASVKNGRFSGGRPKGLFLTEASTAAC